MGTFKELKKQYKNKTVRPQKESSIESYLFRQCRKIGYRAVKYIDPSYTSGPDRQILGPYACIEFVETKTDQGRLTIGQRKYHEELKRMGYSVHTVCTKKQVDRYIEYLKKRTLREARREIFSSL